MLPLLDAACAGLWQFLWTDEGLSAIPRPGFRVDDEDRLHCEDGPAVLWPDGGRYWFWRDTQVPQKVIEAPDELTAKEILAERNVEIRRVMIERFGQERLLHEAGGFKQVHPADDFGTLWRLEFPDDEPLVLVEVVNSTAEPDGTFRNYFLRVPPTVRTAREAVAWTFGVDERNYRVEVET